jgi:ACS family D-galactonate transporter-like MFS transporter
MELRNRWTMAVLTSAGIFVTFVLRVNLSPVAPLLERDLRMSDFQLGLALSAFLWIYTLLQPVAGLVTDRFGAKLSLFVGGLATSLLTIATGFVNSFFALFTLRAALGVTQAPNFVSGAKVSSSGWYRKEERARATSIWIAGGRLGPVLAFPFAAWLGVIYGWPSAFFATGLMGVLWCGVWLLVFQDNPEGQKRRKEATSKARFRQSLPVVMSPLGLGLSLASFGQGYVAYYLNLWLPTYLVREQKFTILNAGILSTLPLISAVITLILVGGMVSDYLVKKGSSPIGVRSKLFSLGMVGASVMLFATAYAPGPYSALAALSFAGAALGFATPSLWVVLVEATPKKFTGTMGGVQNLGGNLAGIVVAVLTGYILEVTKSFFFALMAGSAAALFGAISALLLVKPLEAK